MRRTAFAPAAIAAVLAGSGCTTNPVRDFDVVYYFYGPDRALEWIGDGEVPPGDRALADLERATALLELGRYEESRSAFERAAAALETDRAPDRFSAPEGPPWQPESHERVLTPTLEVAASLALQDSAAAETAADRVAEAVAEFACDGCRFDFSRVLCAFAYGEVGRFGDGLALLSGVSTEAAAIELVDELRQRLERGLVGAEPEGLAPPPVTPERRLVAILLLGRGPYKIHDRLQVTPAQSVRWCQYLPRDPQAVAAAVLETDEPVLAVELDDVLQLAESSLDWRAGRVIAEGGAGVDSEAVDVRHWSSLPASLQLLSARVPAAADAVDLVYLSPEGFEVDRETIRFPASWAGGVVYLTRRMP